jgi:hypothetical protein
VHLFPWSEGGRNKGRASGEKGGRAVVSAICHWLERRTGDRQMHCKAAAVFGAARARLLPHFYLIFQASFCHGVRSPFACFDQNTGTYKARAPHCHCSSLDRGLHCKKVSSISPLVITEVLLPSLTAARYFFAVLEGKGRKAVRC